MLIVQTAIAVALMLLQVSGSDQQRRLVIPVVMPLAVGNNSPLGGCETSAAIALDTFNSQPAFQRDFKVELMFFHEGPGSTKGLAQLMKFHRMKLANDTVKSPLVVGPFTSRGCMAMASVTEFINVVETAIGCGTPTMSAQRQRFPNFYRTRVSGQETLYTVIQYVKNVGKWKSIAILTTAGTIFNYGVAKIMYLEAIKRGIEVPFFDIEAELTEAGVQRLKNSQIRIIVLQDGSVKKFLCLAYKLGMTGPRYVFFLYNYSFFRLRDLPYQIPDFPGCTRDHLAAVLPQVKFHGAQSHLLNRNVTSSLGAPYEAFLRTYEHRTGGKIFRDHMRKELCHDAMAKSLLALDKAETALKQQKSSLLDYEYTPEKVMKVVNQSLAAIDYVGFQYGRSRFSRRLEVDEHPDILFSWNEETDDKVFEYSTQLIEGGDAYNADDYVATPLNPVKWKTSDGKPPRATYRKEVLTVDVSNQGFLAVLVVTAALSLSQIGLLVWVNVKKRRCGGELEILVAACLFFNAGAIIHAARTSQQPRALCITRPILTVIAMALLEVFFWVRLSGIGLRKMNREEMRQFPGAVTAVTRIGLTAAPGRRHPTAAGRAAAGRSAAFASGSAGRRVQSVSERIHTRIRDIAIKATSSSTTAKIAEVKQPARARSLLFCIGPPVVLLVLWMTIHPVGFIIDQSAKPRYDYETDTMFHDQIYACASQSYIAWVMGIAAWNLVIVTSAAFKVYRLRKVPQINVIQAYKGIQLGVVNLEMLLIASMLVLATLSSPVNQQIALAAVSLVFSALSAAVVFYFEFAKAAVNPSTIAETHPHNTEHH